MKELTLAMMGEDLMIYDLSASSIYILNRTAALIYKLFNEHKETEDIVQYLSDNYSNKDTDKLLSDVKAYRSRLEEIGLLKAHTNFKEGSFVSSEIVDFIKTNVAYDEPEITIFSEEELKNRYADVFATSVVFSDLWTDIGGGPVKPTPA